ncbi:pentatricopeptide repeat-containing protein At2g29760, chloroplastic-like [Argentina anserina]|uniref:pentatricopeptide repeat-containing protein At2g29760, chloroplastic-like n=1 Tax=Argentina anserina TaxID=57926 RepID=UPI0021765121|nr:pentatricopeptide repeat-containing protein At2g29760, chloroplastic-like [Potentilla anserina]XP_050379546.1 pentatricopeptide repeat-containing protein At2g29760, chloroplastic-like [Potentilla anserina]XP_050379550.1 pentatricopeptide repeat-containing protein At2g29760, chloroplastic-like [Potentilla anserina]
MNYLILSSPNLKSCSPLHHHLACLLRGPLSPSHLLQIHAQVFLLGAHQHHLIATRLINHYSPSPHVALRILHSLHNPNLLPLNAAIRLAAEHRLFSTAFSLFKSLLQTPLSPNGFTFSFLLKSCFRCQNSVPVRKIHAIVVKTGFLRDTFVCNGLLSVYGKGVRDLGSARKVFDGMPDKNVTCCWTSLIDGYAKAGEAEEALRVFVRMVEGDLRPEDATLVSVLSACSSLDMGKIEEWVSVMARVGGSVVGLDSVRTVLVYLYGKWGRIEESREMFDGVSESGKRSVLPWNAVIGAYVQNGCPLECLSVFRMMVGDPSREPNHVTMVSVLSACAQVGDLELGRWVHEYLESKGNRSVIGSNKILATALIDMYSKCGSLEKAKEVFYQMESKDIVSFNAMIMGLAVNSEGQEALRLFSKVQDFGLLPNGRTFLGALCACNHSGLSEKGRQIFHDMTSSFSISPKIEHYACYIDLLARVGLLEEALEVVTSMPFEPNSIVWGALLGGCLLHSRLDYAEYVSGKLVQSDPNNTGGYVMLANAFASDHRWGDVSSLRRFMREKGVTKKPGCSWISNNGVVHEFLVGRSSHPQSEIICNTLNGLVKQMKIAVDIL